MFGHDTDPEEPIIAPTIHVDTLNNYVQDSNLSITWRPSWESHTKGRSSLVYEE